MKRKLSILVLFAEFLMITVLHVAKYKKEQSRDFTIRRATDITPVANRNTSSTVIFARFN
jgi:hypothetical protein